jgi:hypothetical protein
MSIVCANTLTAYMSRLAVYPFIIYRTDTTQKLPFGFYAFTKESTAFFAVVLFGSYPRLSCQPGESSFICSRHRGKKEEDIEKVAGHTVLAGYGEGGCRNRKRRQQKTVGLFQFNLYV